MSDGQIDMAGGWIAAAVQQRAVWEEGLVTLTLDWVPPDFEPGQFVNLGELDAEGKRIKRSYSLASPPGVPAEFFVVRVPDGSLTPGLVESEVGSLVHVQPKAHGFFGLKWVPEGRTLWMMSTGTGLAPYLSILRAGRLWSRFERAVVVHGARTRCQLAYAEELRALVESHAGRLVYLPMVSREAPGDGELAGRLTTAITDGRLERAVGEPLSPVNAQVMLCGNPAMIDEAEPLLAERGLLRNRRRTPGHVTFERYW